MNLIINHGEHEGIHGDHEVCNPNNSLLLLAEIPPPMDRQKELNEHFQRFRKNIIGDDLVITTPFGKKRILYADWIASGRLYRPIEEQIMNIFGPYVGNTHTETSETGTLMTKAYHLAQNKIKDHVHASASDVVITSGFGMTGVINKFQRILGLRGCGHLAGRDCLDERTPPLFSSLIWSIIPTTLPGLRPLPTLSSCNLIKSCW